MRLKRNHLTVVLILVCILVLAGCSSRTMDDIIQQEASITGIVKSITSDALLMENETGEYWVSLNVENKDSMTHFSKGDEVVVYFDGNAAESDPMQINIVYAITLKTPADRATEEVTERIPMVMVNGTLYLDTGCESSIMARCGMMDGEITSQVAANEMPTVDDQSNFGTGYGYQYGAAEGTIELYRNGKWWVFATEEAREQLQQSGDNGTDLDPTHLEAAGRALTQEEIDRVNEAFFPILFDKEENPIGTNLWSCFFTSYYDDVRELDFAEFLAYYPGDGSTVEPEEFALLKEQEDIWFRDVPSLADMPVPVHRHPARVIERTLQEYAGITLEELDTSKVYYLPEYDAFYNDTSDYAPGTFQCTRGEINGDVVRLYEEYENGADVLTLRKDGDRYHVMAHQQVSN